MERKERALEEINRSLEPGWQAKLNADGRLYYINHNDKITRWLPPSVNWTCKEALPFGWECALDKTGKPYFLNHVDCTSTLDDPREDEELFLVERQVKLMRDSVLGFGFVAGSEKPVIVRSVTEGGPCDGKLFSGDEILRINNEDVKKLNREYVINKVRSCPDVIFLTVAQPSMDRNSGRKSSLLSISKKLKLKNNPSRVRFSEEVEEDAKIGKDSSLFNLPGVLKVYLENQQTKSFKYDSKTLVRDVLNILQEKLDIKCMEYFSLLVKDYSSPAKPKLSFLQDHELIQRCCNDVVEGRYGSELKYDSAIRLAALQMQEHVLTSKLSAKVSVKAVEKECGLSKFLPQSLLQGVKVKDIRRAMNHFIKMNQNLAAPGQKHLTALQVKLHYLKIVSELKTFGGRYFTAVLMVSEVFINKINHVNQDNITTDVTQGKQPPMLPKATRPLMLLRVTRPLMLLRVTRPLMLPWGNQPQMLPRNEGEKRSEVNILVGPKCGISHVINTKNNVMSLLADFSHVTFINVYNHSDDGMQNVELKLDDMKPVHLIMQSAEARDFACLISGYYKILVNRDKCILPPIDSHLSKKEQEAPQYHGKHRVQAAEWSYPTDLISQLISEEEEEDSDDNDVIIPGYHDPKNSQDGEYIVDLVRGPPHYEEDIPFINSGISMCMAEKEAGDGASTEDNVIEEISAMESINRDSVSETSSKGSLTNSLPEVDYPTDELSTFELSKDYDISDAVATESIKSIPSKGGIELLSFKLMKLDRIEHDILGDGGWDDVPKEEEEEGEEEEESDSDDSDCSSSDSNVIDMMDNSRTSLLNRDSIIFPRPKLNINVSALKHDDSEMNVTPPEINSDVIDLTRIPPPLIETAEEHLENLEVTAPPLEFTDTVDEIPVSVIDLPSPVLEDAPQLKSSNLDTLEVVLAPPDIPVTVPDETHRVQHVAIDALVEVDVKEQNDVESDSGNETVSSETIEITGCGEHVECSHSPSDYMNLISRQKTPVLATGEMQNIPEHSLEIKNVMEDIVLPPPPDSEFADDSFLDVVLPPPLLSEDDIDFDFKDLPPPLIFEDDVLDTEEVIAPPEGFGFPDNKEEMEFIPPPPLFDTSEVKETEYVFDTERDKPDNSHVTDLDLIVCSANKVNENDESSTDLPGLIVESNHSIKPGEKSHSHTPDFVDKSNHISGNSEPNKIEISVKSRVSRKKGYVSPSLARKSYSFDFSYQPKDSKMDDNVRSSSPLAKSIRTFSSDETLTTSAKSDNESEDDASLVSRTSSLRWSFDSSRSERRSNSFSSRGSRGLQSNALFYNPSDLLNVNANDTTKDRYSKPLLKGNTFGNMFSGIAGTSKVAPSGDSASAPSSPSSTGVRTSSSMKTVKAVPPAKGSPTLRTSLPLKRVSLRPVAGQTSGVPAGSGSSEKKHGPLKAFKLLSLSSERRNSSGSEHSDGEAPTNVCKVQDKDMSHGFESQEQLKLSRAPLQRSISNPVSPEKPPTAPKPEKISSSSVKPPVPPRRHSIPMKPIPPPKPKNLSSPIKPNSPPPPPPPLTSPPLNSPSLVPKQSPPDSPPPPLPVSSPPISPPLSPVDKLMKRDEAELFATDINVVNILTQESEIIGKSPMGTATLIENREYSIEDGVETAHQDIAVLISDLDMMLDAVVTTDMDLGNQKQESEQFNDCKQILMNEAKEFATCTKVLVSSAAHSKEKLIEAVNRSLHSLARLFVGCHNTMELMSSHGQATHLATKVKNIANYFGDTLKAAEIACGKSLNDPTMKLLLKEVQNMAAILSAMMRTLRILQNR
uniref:FERM and PDZ domain-containing protein 4-like n=1 Tax=Saccoglossus kowalevskii TaxID=10224 RepID=A0ABM0MGX6_SACKO|nr:PREDICTED: FERM and PDZ domain-containing protein 4-like [Saccoglossus kowalevskii]